MCECPTAFGGLLYKLQRLREVTPVSVEGVEWSQHYIYMPACRLAIRSSFAQTQAKAMACCNQDSRRPKLACGIQVPPAEVPPQGAVSSPGRKQGRFRGSLAFEVHASDCMIARARRRLRYQTSDRTIKEDSKGLESRPLSQEAKDPQLWRRWIDPCVLSCLSRPAELLLGGLGHLGLPGCRFQGLL